MHARMVLSAGHFFSAAQFALVFLVAAPYLATVISERSVGFVLALGAFLTLAVFPFVPRLVRLYGERKLLLAAITVALLTLLALTTNPGPTVAVAGMALFFMLQPIIAYAYDLLLEATITDESETGRVHTFFITAANVAYVLTPLAAGLLLGQSSMYPVVFAAAALMYLPLLFIFLFARLPEGDPPHFLHMFEVVRCLIGDRDVRAVSISMVVLHFFFGIAPFFIPLYLHNELGIPWSELGWIFAIMLVPFLLLEYPAGWLADKLWGDQELMALGFLVMGGALAAVAFVTVHTPLVSILIVLVLTRVGAAVVEATVESHFFRRISAKDANSVGVFRMLRPVGLLIGPIVGGFILLVGSYPMLFFLTGLGIVVMGVGSALSIKDVR